MSGRSAWVDVWRGAVGRRAARTAAPRAGAPPRSLRTRLSVIVFLVVVLTLSLVGITSVLALQAFLAQRATSQLHAGSTRATALLATRQVPAISAAQLRALTPSGAFLIAVDGSGDPVVAQHPPHVGADRVVAALRDVPPNEPVTVSRTGTSPVRAVRVFIPASARLSVRLTDRSEPLGVGELILGYDTSDGRATVHRLASIEAAVIAGSALLLAVLLPTVLTRGLRPLHDMTATARAIAEGDREQRLPQVTTAETAVLAAALNEALDARALAEGRVRDFVADASHELRTPLTTIRGWADLYLEGGLAAPGTLDKAMGRIADATRHLTTLVEELGLLAQLDAGRPLNRDAVDLVSLAEGAVDDMRVVDPTLQITVTAHQLPLSARRAVCGDEQRLRQVLLNLLGNAVQHTPPGTPVAIDIAEAPAHVTLTVWDGGTAIPADQLPHLFDRFYRADSSRRHGGTGLGLAIVAGVVNSHGGVLQVHSDQSGTRFEVTIPTG